MEFASSIRRASGAARITRRVFVAGALAASVTVCMSARLDRAASTRRQRGEAYYGPLRDQQFMIPAVSMRDIDASHLRRTTSRGLR